MQEQTSRRVFLPVVLGVVALVGGWHYLCHLALEDTVTQATHEFLRDHLEGASAHVDVGPFSNVIDIRVELNSKPTNELVELIEGAVVEVIREQLEPKIERALHTRTRRSMDVYAMLLPYTVLIAVGEPDARHRASEPGQRGSGDAILIREVQHALSDCGYELGQPDGVLGPRTQQAIRAFRSRNGLAERSIPLRELPSLVRQKCPVTTPRAQIKQLIKQWSLLNDRCRGGSGDEQETSAACEQREEIGETLEAQGWCYGHEPQRMYERDWEPCRGGEFL